MMETESSAIRPTQPELQIDTNDNAEYGVLAECWPPPERAEMVKIGFVRTEPDFSQAPASGARRG